MWNYYLLWKRRRPRGKDPKESCSSSSSSSSPSDKRTHTHTHTNLDHRPCLLSVVLTYRVARGRERTAEENMVVCLLVCRRWSVGRFPEWVVSWQLLEKIMKFLGAQASATLLLQEEEEEEKDIVVDTGEGVNSPVSTKGSTSRRTGTEHV